MATDVVFSVAHSRNIDVAQAEAGQAGALATISAARSQLVASEADYQQTIGEAPEVLTYHELESGLLPGTQENARQIALTNHPAIHAASELVHSADAGLISALVGGRPTLDLVGAVHDTQDSLPATSLLQAFEEEGVSASLTLQLTYRSIREVRYPVVSGCVLGALGVVFGDIGTSPLYALTAAVGVVVPAGGSVSETVALGLASLVFWALFLVITLKYVLVILRTDQNGEGGVLALLTLLDLRQSKKTLSGRILLVIAIVGGAMLFGDGVVTLAISVLSAVEGLGEWSTVLTPYSVPIAVIILAVLFLAQRYGARRIGTLFGPVMLLWFIVLGAGGAMAIVQHPLVLRAVSPVWAGEFLYTHTGVASAVLGAVFLAVTGGEALYADLEQFGRRTIAHAWMFIAMPAQLLSCFGQAALLLNSADVSISHIFFDLYPTQFLLPVVLIATCATVIA